jgi:hypothetical protein
VEDDAADSSHALSDATLGAAKNAVFAALETYDARDSGAQQLIETNAVTALINASSLRIPVFGSAR